MNKLNSYLDLLVKLSFVAANLTQSVCALHQLQLQCPI